MKTTRKIFALLLCLAMVLGMATTAFAYDVELTGDLTTGHTYKVYQIFTGDVADIDGKPVLANVLYGSNYPVRPEDDTSTGAFRGESVPEDVLNSLNQDGASAFAAGLTLGTEYGVLNESNSWRLTGVPAGYYLIKDVTELPDETTDSLSQYIVQIVGDITMAPKADKLIPDKVISGDDYDPDGNAETEDDTVTVDGKNSNGAIGSVVNYKLTVKVPKNANNYTYYYCVLNDTLSKGLTFNNDVVVTVDGKTMSKDTNYKLYTGEAAGGKTFEVAMLDAHTMAGKTITVTYSATINKDAIIGVEGNPNNFDVIYSNDPNYNYAEEPENPDGKPDNDKNAPTGQTPTYETRTYVVGLEITKTDGQNALAGAEFQITGTSLKHVLVSGTEYVKSTEVADNAVFADDGVYYKLNDGSYTTDAPVIKETYVAKTDNRDGGYVKDGETYKVATDEQLANKDVPLYKKMSPNDDLYESTEVTYKHVKIEKDEQVAEKVDIKAYVGEDGILKFVGLGEGVYTIEEITVPAGYNQIKDITVTIDWTAPDENATAENKNKCTWEGEYAIGDAEPEDLTFDEGVGMFKLTVVNQKGSELPETGGIGTTLFYVFGSVMVLAAVILLVTKKRMSMAN